MPKSNPVTMLVTYRPRQGKQDQLLALVRKHWLALHQVGLVTEEPVRIWRATDKRSGEVSIVEMFQWKDADERQGSLIGPRRSWPSGSRWSTSSRS